MWICPRCYRSNQDRARYCIGCGMERGAAPADGGIPRRRWLPWALLGLFGLICIAVGLILLLVTPAPQPPRPAPVDPTPDGTAEIEPVDPSAGPQEIVTPTPPFSGYLEETDQLSEQGLEQLRQVMENTIAENIRSSWSPAEHLVSSDYRGFLLLTPKESGSTPRNVLILVYENRVNIRIPAEGVDKSLDYYYALRFENVWCNADGSLVLPAPIKPEGEIKANVPKHYFYYKGYPDLDALRREQVDSEHCRAAEVWD